MRDNRPMPDPISAGVIPLRRTSDGWRVLILRAYRQWDFPKGIIDPGETPFDAARREAEEEAALTDLEFPLGEIFRDTEPYLGGKIARFYLAVTARQEIVLPVSAELGRPEHQEGRWASIDEAAGLMPRWLLPILDWVREALANPRMRDLR